MLRKFKKKLKKSWVKRVSEKRNDGAKVLMEKPKDLRVWIFNNDRTNTLCGPKDFRHNHGIML
jgi:hypothetical protein